MKCSHCELELEGDGLIPEEREAYIVMAYLLRDAARKARDGGLQEDDDEFDRLIRIVNSPPDRVIAEIVRCTNRKPSPVHSVDC